MGAFSTAVCTCVGCTQIVDVVVSCSGVPPPPRLVCAVWTQCVPLCVCVPRPWGKVRRSGGEGDGDPGRPVDEGL